MGIHWLSVLCAWALFAQFCVAFPEGELVDGVSQDVPEIPEETEEVRDKRQSGCKDLLDYCSQWPDKYCQDYKDYMKTNCPKKCGYCSGPTQPPVCADKSQHCSGWKASGYCGANSQWHSYMKDNCAKTCGFCGGGGGGGSCSGGESSKVKACKFDQDTCDWHNVPFDDNMDFVIRSSSSGGPSSGAGGSGKFLVTESSSGKAQLLLPLELVLANHNSDHGSMCIRFQVFMRGGSLKLYEVANRKGSAKTIRKTVSGDQGSQWKCVTQTVPVSVNNQLLLEASASGSSISIDDISFADGACS